MQGIAIMADVWETTTEMMPAKPSWMTDDIQRALQEQKFPLTNDGMLMLWQRVKDNLAILKEAEMDYRKICATFLVPEPQKHEGMNTVPIGDQGWNAKVGIKLNYKLDSDNDKIWECLDRIEKLGNEGPFIAKRLVSWSPNFLLTEYRQLQEDAEKDSKFAKDVLKELETILTITEAAPSLEIKEPKAKKK